MKLIVFLLFTLSFFPIESAAQASDVGSPNSTKKKQEQSECLSGNCTDGWGNYQHINDKGQYIGFFFNGSRSGYGLYQWADAKYIGNWDTAMNGYGVYIKDNGDDMSGMWKDGQLNGYGTTITDGEWKRGVFENGNMSITYNFYSNNVDKGCTAGDCESKYGRYEWSNGDYFVGFFKNGNMLMGKYNFADGNKYSGEFNSNNQYHGTGRYYQNKNYM